MPTRARCPVRKCMEVGIPRAWNRNGQAIHADEARRRGHRFRAAVAGRPAFERWSALAMLRLTQGCDAASVVMAAHGRMDNLRTLRSVVARSLLWRCDLPVMVLPPVVSASAQAETPTLRFLSRASIPSSSIEPGAPILGAMNRSLAIAAHAQRGGQGRSGL